MENNLENKVPEEQAPKSQEERTGKSPLLEHNFVSLMFLLAILLVLALTRCSAFRDEEPEVPPTGPVSEPAPAKVDSEPQPTAVPLATTDVVDDEDAVVIKPTNPLPPTATPEPAIVKKPKLNALAIALEGPNHYWVKVTATDLGNSFRSLYRKDRFGNLQILSGLYGETTVVKDENVTAGETYSYFASAADEENLIMESRVSLTIPKDEVLGSNLLAKEIKGVNRVFFEKGSVFSTSGLDVVIEAEEIIANDALIQTLPAGIKTNERWGQPKGGSLHISARRGHGSLRINASGQDGSDGKDGDDGVAGAAGPAGQPGEWGMNAETHKHLLANFVDSFGTSMRRSPRPPQDPEWGHSIYGVPFYICSRAPTNGGDGTNGTPGKDGEAGGDGGESTEIYVVIAEESPLNVEIVANPGQGGFGGRGGKGGAGGAGGAPGALDQGHRCPPAKAGATGKTGIPGRQGSSGIKGMKKPVCVKMGNSDKGPDCEKFKQGTGDMT